MSKRARAKSQSRAKTSLAGTDKLPLIEHLKELKRRLITVAVSIVAGSVIAYGVQNSIIAVLLRPSHGQHFIYTSPLGGINFLFSVCLDLGIAVSVPLMIYQLLRFLQPLMRATTLRFITTISLVSGLVAMAGVLFGYYIGLPAALNFLLHQFQSAQIKPLVTIQSYMQFVSMYLLGSALMFQLPLLLIIINRIKPLKPSRLLHFERHIIVGAFIVAFIMNPTPNVLDQLMVVVPIILMYQVGILIVWFLNRGGHSAKFQQLLDQDAARRSERLARAMSLQPVLATDSPLTSLQPALVPVGIIDVTPPADTAPDSAPRYGADIRPVRRTDYQQYTPRLIQ